MIDVKNISKSFGDIHVLNDISIDLQEGKINMIIGKSGAGKSVLLKCLVGLLDVDKGIIAYDGRNFSAMNYKKKKEIRKEIGMLFQGSALYDSMSVIDNVMFPLEMFTELNFEERKERAIFCLRRVNIVESADCLFPAEISGGMQKRVAIARAIALQPKYLFCDEPNSGLDPKTAIIIDNLIKEITEESNITTIVNTHDMNSVMEIGEKIAYINNGVISWIGNKEELLESNNEQLNDFVFASELFKRLKKL